MESWGVVLVWLDKQFEERRVSKKMMNKQVKTNEEEEEGTDMVWTMGQLRTKEE
jgi:hypothetical protein